MRPAKVVCGPQIPYMCVCVPVFVSALRAVMCTCLCVCVPCPLTHIIFWQLPKIQKL